MHFSKDAAAKAVIVRVGTGVGIPLVRGFHSQLQTEFLLKEIQPPDGDPLPRLPRLAETPSRSTGQRLMDIRDYNVLVAVELSYNMFQALQTGLHARAGPRSPASGTPRVGPGGRAPNLNAALAENGMAKCNVAGLRSEAFTTVSVLLCYTATTGRPARAHASKLAAVVELYDDCPWVLDGQQKGWFASINV